MNKLLLTCCVTLASATLTPADDQPTRPYADDPAVLKQLVGLDANTAAILTPVKFVDDAGFYKDGPVPDRYRGGPGTRDYCNKMPYAPDRETAVYAGGSHQTYRPNDFWEYHLGSNSWHLLFGPEGGNHAQLKATLYFGAVKKLRENADAELTDKEAEGLKTTRAWWAEHVVLRDGHVVTRAGAPIMPAHTWDGITYDPRVSRMLWASGAGPGNQPEYHAVLTGTPLEAVQARIDEKYTDMWMIDLRTRKWVHYRTANEHPEFRGMGASMTYIPDWGESVYYVAASNVSPGSFQMWRYDAVADRWTRIEPNGGVGVSRLANTDKVAPLSEQQMAYSPKHKKLVAVLKSDVFAYDIERNEWSKLHTDDRIDAHDARTVFAYDSANDVFLLANPKGKTKLAAFSLATNRWEVLEPDGPTIPELRYGQYKGFYHPVHNVFVLHAGDGRTWVYRYR